MKNRHAIVTLFLAVFLIGLPLFASGQEASRESAHVDFPSSASSRSAPPLIATALPVRRTFTLQLPWIGTVETQASVELTALTAGLVVAIQAEDQNRVAKGGQVMRLGGRQIEEEHAKLTTEIDSLKTRLDLASQTIERLKESLKTRLTTKDQLAAAQETQAGIEARLREARLSLKILASHVGITAPMNGIFTNRRVSVGQYVKAGQVLGEIIDTEHLRVAASLFPPPGSVLIGKKATVRLGAGQTLAGTVRRLLPRASKTGAATVWIEGGPIDARLRPGQTAGGNIVLQVEPEALAVPKSAIVYDAREHPFLFVRHNNNYEQLAIRTGLEQDGWVEVLSGLSPDQPVVTRGAYELFYLNFNERYKVQD